MVRAALGSDAFKKRLETKRLAMRRSLEFLLALLKYPDFYFWPARRKCKGKYLCWPLDVISFLFNKSLIRDFWRPAWRQLWNAEPPLLLVEISRFIKHWPQSWRLFWYPFIQLNLQLKLLCPSRSSWLSDAPRSRRHLTTLLIIFFCDFALWLMMLKIIPIH